MFETPLVYRRVLVYFYDNVNEAAAVEFSVKFLKTSYGHDFSQGITAGC